MPSGLVAGANVAGTLVVGTSEAPVMISVPREGWVNDVQVAEGRVFFFIMGHPISEPGQHAVYELDVGSNSATLVSSLVAERIIPNADFGFARGALFFLGVRGIYRLDLQTKQTQLFHAFVNPVTDGLSCGLAIHEDRLFFASDASGIHTIDLSQVSEPPRSSLIAPNAKLVGAAGGFYFTRELRAGSNRVTAVPISDVPLARERARRLNLALNRLSGVSDVFEYKGAICACVIYDTPAIAEVISLDGGKRVWVSDFNIRCATSAP